MCLAIFVGLVFTGCGHDGPPPNTPKPDVQKTAKGLEMARKLLAILDGSDSTSLADMKAQLEKEMKRGLDARDADAEHDAGRLHATIYRVEKGEKSKARDELEAMIERSEPLLNSSESKTARKS